MSAPVTPQSSRPAKCDACSRPLENPIFCAGCHTLHPAENADYFELLGVARGYDIDVEVLRRRYLAVAREVHPDRAIAHGGSAATLSLQLSARLNRAYAVLGDPLLRSEYLLESAGGRSAAEDRTVPAEVLAQALLLREALEEAQAAGDAAAIQHVRATAREQLAVLQEAIAELARRLPADEAARATLRARLNAAKYYQKMLEAC
ncbi:MAG: Fe-S protein assembly co-chaperone HscB [Phycisphaerae bacterium]